MDAEATSRGAAEGGTGSDASDAGPDLPILAHRTKGRGPALLLLNGGMMSMAAWEPIASQFESSYAVLRCDFRGQLLTPGPPPKTIHGHVRDVVRLLDDKGISDAHVAGTSFGAIVGLALAATAPARVRSMTAIAASDRVTPPMWEAATRMRDACRAAARGGGGEVVFDLIAAATYSPDFRQRHGEELALRRQATAALPPEWFEGIDGLLAALEGLDLGPLLPRVTCPVLVLAGGRDETFPVVHSRALAGAMPRASLRIIPEGSHGLVIEQHGQVVRSMADFLADVDDGP
jgi:pimeloyl-ACP methyl ester carboxylesterase